MVFIHVIVQLILVLVLHAVVGNILSLILSEDRPISSFIASVLSVGFIPSLVMFGYSFLLDAGSRTPILWILTAFYVFSGGAKLVTKKDSYEVGMGYGLLIGTVVMWVNHYFLLV